MRDAAKVGSSDEASAAEIVEVDHALHWIAMIGASAYAWQLHGLLAGVGAMIGLAVAIGVTNMIILTKSGSLRLVRANRWSWVILAFVLLAVTGASGGTV